MTPQFTDMSGLHSPLCLEMALVGYSILLENRHTYAMATKLRLVYPVLRYLCYVLAQYQGNLVVQHLCLDSLFAISVNAPPEHMRLQRWFENRAARRFGRNGELLERPITMQQLYPFWRCVVHCELFCSLIPVLSPYSLRTLQFERGACRYCQGLAE